MKRQRATELVQQVLQRAVAGEWPANLVTEIRVFGSYMRGALEPADVDIAYKFDWADDARWERHFQDTFFAGKDTMAAARKSLRGTSRGISLTQIHGDGEGYEDIPMTVLWQKGESLDTAFERLASIKPDAAAGKAVRHHMTEAFEGLDKYLPRYVRGELKQLADEGVIRIRKVELADQEDFDVVPTRINLDRLLYNMTLRWNEDSPLRRAAAGAISDIHARHGSLGNIELGGKPFHEDGSAAHTVVVDFKLRYIEHLMRSFREEGCTEWVELLNPSKKGVMHALIIEPGDSAALAGWVPNGFFRD
jgi:hypothetical protein